MDSSDEEQSSIDEEAAALGLPLSDDDVVDGGASADAREAIYNADAMHERLEEIGWAEQAGWDESQVVTSSGRCDVADVDDDLGRELAFYQQALSAAKDAVARFEAAGTPWVRPPDYYAEMVKSDEHMGRVKEQLLHEQRQIEAADERRKARESKRFQKQLQAERLKAKAADKKAAIAGVAKLRKMREKSGFEGDFDYDAALEAMEADGQKKRQLQAARRLRAGEKPLPGKRRAYKNEKFGFGGRKRGQKRNDAVSAASMEDYRGSGGGGGRGGGKKLAPRGGGAGKGGAGKGGGKKGAKAKRPGKARRAAMRAGK